jgi:hypothetical protein
MGKIEEGDAEAAMAAAAAHHCSSAIITGQVGYRRLPLRGLDLCLSRCLSTSHYPCQRGAVPAQSCINPAACRSRVFTELSLRCTTMVRPRDDYSMTARATVRLASATATRATTKLLRWQMLLAFTTDGRMKRLEHLLRPRSGHSSQDGSGETSTAVESWLAVVPMHVRALRIRGVLITTAVVAGCK